MRFSSAIALAAVVPAFVSAQGTVRTVNVGSNGSLAFDPASVTANIGDTITFVFQAKNHSVVQSTFADPCTKSNINGTAGFASGFQPVEGNGAQLPSFSINVTQSDPIWFYCGQKIPVDHCQMGMVGAVNAPPDKTVDQFKTKAMANSSSTASPSGTAPATPSGSSGAMRLSSGGAAGLLSLMGLMAGLAL